MNKFKIQTVQTYNKSALVMARKFNALGARKEDIVRAFSYVSPNPAVLEIGCGNGREAKEITKYTDHYIGVDISKNFIDIAKKYVPKAKFIVADIEKFKPPGNLNLVLAFASLIHLNKTDLTKVFKKIYKALAHDGTLYLSMKYGSCKRLTKRDELGTRTYYFYTLSLVKKIAGSKYKSMYENRLTLRGQKWFTLILKKIS